MIEVNVHFLMEIDKLVQLLESPVFMGKYIAVYHDQIRKYKKVFLFFD